MLVSNAVPAASKPDDLPDGARGLDQGLVSNVPGVAAIPTARLDLASEIT